MRKRNLMVALSPIQATLPKNLMCHKCGDTGSGDADPNHICEKCLAIVSYAVKCVGCGESEIIDTHAYENRITKYLCEDCDQPDTQDMASAECAICRKMVEVPECELREDELFVCDPCFNRTEEGDDSSPAYSPYVRPNY